jgi:TatD DNase family protein
MNYWIDTHAHIYQPNFDEDIQEIIQRCLDANVQKVILPNIDIESLKRVENLSQQYPSICLPTVGLHPCDVKENFQEVLEEMKNWAFHPNVFPENKIYAIGETGLDYYWDIAFKEEQKAALEIQISWAKTLKLPIILHTRESVQDTIDIIRANKDESLSGVFHCFSGNLEEALQIIEMGDFYLGIGGPLTYKKSTLPDILKEIPIDKIILETDAPYLTPAPFRGKRNESSYIPIIGQKLAEVKNCPIDDIQIQTTKNAIQLFNL